MMKTAVNSFLHGVETIGPSCRHGPGKIFRASKLSLPHGLWRSRGRAWGVETKLEELDQKHRKANPNSLGTARLQAWVRPGVEEERELNFR